MTEFEIIRQFFADRLPKRPDVIYGIGDDAALTRIPAHHLLVTTTDTMVAGVHFPLATTPFDIAYKALAVNLSDLAAMGATPAWFTLALTLPESDPKWLKAFSEGLFTLAQLHNIQLIGGDLTRGPLTITIQAFGLIPEGEALLRSQAKPGDLIYVTGTLGDAGLALKNLPNRPDDYLLSRLNRPEPRIAAGEALRKIAHAAIDISDGLAADLGHILEQSQVGAIINIEQLPLSAVLTEKLTSQEAIQLALTAGDDYELCFTIPAEHKAELTKKIATFNCQVTCIGNITSGKELILQYNDGRKYHDQTSGYQHF